MLSRNNVSKASYTTTQGRLTLCLTRLENTTILYDIWSSVFIIGDWQNNLWVYQYEAIGIKGVPFVTGGPKNYIFKFQRLGKKSSETPEGQANTTAKIKKTNGQTTI